jgi:chromate transporter
LREELEKRSPIRSCSTADHIVRRACRDVLPTLRQGGALVFGSGYAMLPFIRDSVVHQFGWLTNQQFAVSLALSLITPGPVTIIGVFIGYKVHGVVGALTGMVNMCFPAWAVTTVVAAPYAKAG